MARRAPMNVVLLVIDSLRARSLAPPDPARPRTPFFDRIGTETLHFRRAYATECWTLPSHCSMFTGLLPSEHRAHFQTMAYTQPAATIAELLSAAGSHTEIVTRNVVFDGTIPGITRGFRNNTRILSPHGPLHPFALILALSKRHVRRRIRTTGSFHPLQRENRRFVATFARSLLPADRPALTYTLERMESLRRKGTPYFVFCNLYDVHVPYPPTPTSILRSFRSLSGCVENLMFPFVIPCLAGHAYLRPGFCLSERSRRMLLGRYHAAIELMDQKVAEFYDAARGAGLLDDTLLIVTSDHGEAFGEHSLYHHDASVYDVNLHVPLWIHDPEQPPAAIDDVVSTRDLFGLIRAFGLGQDLNNTIADPDYRAVHPIALAEHFYYPRAPWIAIRYRQNVAAAIGRRHKLISRREGRGYYDLENDADELHPAKVTLHDFIMACRRDGAPAGATSAVTAHLSSWQHDVESEPRMSVAVRSQDVRPHQEFTATPPA